MIKKLLLTAMLTASFSDLLLAEDDVIVIESTITGSQEQPKVISIVPWKGVLDPGYIGEEVEGLGQTANTFQSLDRISFNRERRYINATRRIKSKVLSKKTD
jgi:hypothetical protein